MGLGREIRKATRGVERAVKGAARIGVFGFAGKAAVQSRDNRKAARQQQANDNAALSAQNAHNAAMEGEARAQSQAAAGARADAAARQAKLNGERQNSQNKINAGIARSGRRRTKGGIFGDDKGNNLGGAANARLG